MSYCFALSFCVFWFLLPKLSLVAGQGYDLHPRMNIHMQSPSYLSTYKRTGMSVVLVSTESLDGAICIVDALTQTTPKILFDRLINPKEVIIFDDFFVEPALVITHGDTVNFRAGAIFIADVSDFNNITTYYNIPPGEYAYGVPTVVTRIEMVVNRYKKVRNEIKEETTYFHGDLKPNWMWTPEVVRGSWEPDTLSSIVVIKAKDKADTYIIFASLGGDQLVMIYTGKGRLYDEGVVMTKMDERNVIYLNTFDANDDGTVDLIVTTDNNYGELLIYEVPMSKAFRDPTKYKKHVILTNFMDSTVGCPTLVKSFYPAYNYTGKPWLLMGGKTCSKASYLAPYWPLDKENWDYKEVVILKDVKSTPGIDSVDLDLDGYTEVFISLTDQHIIKVFSFKEALPSSSISFELPLNFMIFCHVFAIFCTYF